VTRARCLEMVEVDTLNQSALEVHASWLHREPLPQERKMEVDLSTAILRAKAAFPALRERTGPGRNKCKSGCSIHIISKPSSQSASSSPAVSPRSAAMSTTPSPSKPSSSFSDLANSLSAFTFTQILTPLPPLFSFTEPKKSCSALPPSSKRPRPSNDVDGPNTADLGCKKRRLRRHLITSRLSQPFSLPATHILNREAAVSSDKIFLKLAAIHNARRITTGGPTGAAAAPALGASEMLRRAAIINRFRLRVAVEAELRGDENVASVAASAGLLHFSAAARFPTTAPAPPDPLPRPVPPASTPHPLSRAAALARASPPGSPTRSGGNQHAEGAVAGLKLPSPVLGPLRGHADDEDLEDEDLVAFPTSEHESRYEPGDEPGEVYADFSVIFGGGGTSEDEEDEEGFEELMDDVDGIPWVAR
jgi:hypothetical protein